ncbi:carbohydrate ABC transporter permease [Nakamurella antarctica]|uniref:Carbohydrate ABC transporter permease n=1 Tax=Nakamurella antarctica TaxID=1902245 RepID=A0A3G8ZT61_9ACTN|nr:carbohydrate ABC transporter permease [Nakamurella antarctica]AZI56971.1 carbohydrate ABC transporter permease [Nakamurella antarctica]
MTTTLSGRDTSVHSAELQKKRGFSTAWLVYLALIFFALIYLFPFFIQIGTSFKTDVEATATPLNPIPKMWTTAAFQTLAQADFPRWFMNSTIVTLSVTVGRVLIDSLAGYALARLHFTGRKAIGLLIISVMAVPGVVLLIPKYLVLVQLNMYDTYAGMIIPLLADAAGIFIMRQFFISIPLEVEEAARIDGASTLRTFWSVVLPMARPAVITLTILSFQGSWNEFSYFIVSRKDPALNTLTSGVASLTSGALGSGNMFPVKMAAALLMTIPVALVFFFFQRFFVQGAGAGAVKG